MVSIEPPTGLVNWNEPAGGGGGSGDGPWVVNDATPLEAARWYLERGLRPIPWEAKGGKKVATVTGFTYLDYVSAPPAKIERVLEAWRSRPEWQVGLALAEPGGLFALDVDSLEQLNRLASEDGIDAKTVSTWYQVSGRRDGGEHYLYRWDPALGAWPKQGPLGERWPNLEVKSNGFIAASPSTHPSGRRYRWSEAGGREIAVVGWQLGGLLASRALTGWGGGGGGSPWSGGGLRSPTTDEAVEALLETGLPPGAHDDALTRLAWRLAAAGEADEAALATLRAVISRTALTGPDWSDADLLGKVRRARAKQEAAAAAWTEGAALALPPAPARPSWAVARDGGDDERRAGAAAADGPGGAGDGGGGAAGDVGGVSGGGDGGGPRGPVSTRGEPPASDQNADNFGNPGVPVESATVVAKRLFTWRDASGERWCGLRHWRGEWRAYTGTHWAALSEDAMRAVLYRFFADAEYLAPVELPDDEDKRRKKLEARKKKGLDPQFDLKPWNPNRGKIADVLGALAGLTEEPEGTEMPGWLDGRAAGGVTVPCANGLLRVTRGEERLEPHAVPFFCGYSLPFAHDPEAGCPRWLDFLGEVFPGDASSAALLQEWFGYVVSGRLDLHKLMALVGASRSGKSTIAKVLTRLLGSGNVAAPMLGSFAANFGLSTLIGKPLAVVDDARYSSKLDVQAVTERLLTITGGSQLDVDRKNRSVWTGVLPTRVMILSNELPNFKDSSEAITNRMLVLHFKQSFLGREDLQLEEKLATELAGVLNWALEGLSRLEERGRFTTATGATEITAELKESVNPMGAFLAEYAVVGPEEWCVVSDFVAEWAMWQGGKAAASSKGFETAVGQKLRAVLPAVSRKRQTVPGRGRVYCYTGVSLRSPVVAWAEGVTRGDDDREVGQ